MKKFSSFYSWDRKPRDHVLCIFVTWSRDLFNCKVNCVSQKKTINLGFEMNSRYFRAVSHIEETALVSYIEYLANRCGLRWRSSKKSRRETRLNAINGPSDTSRRDTHRWPRGRQSHKIVAVIMSNPIVTVLRSVEDNHRQTWCHSLTDL